MSRQSFYVGLFGIFLSIFFCQLAYPATWNDGDTAVHNVLGNVGIGTENPISILEVAQTGGLVY